MKHIRPINEFFGLFKKKQEDKNIEITLSEIKDKLSKYDEDIDPILVAEAEEKFGSVVIEINKLLRSSKIGEAELKQNPCFFTKSCEDVPNWTLIDMIKVYYTGLGFGFTKSCDGRNKCKDDFVRIFTPFK